MSRIVSPFVLLPLLLLSASAAAQEEKPPQKTPEVVADPVADSRARLVRDPGGHAAMPQQLVFTPDGQKLVSVGDDRTIQVWDVATKERLRVIRPPLGDDGQGTVPTSLVVDCQGEQLAFCVAVKLKDDKSAAALNRVYWSFANGRLEKTTDKDWSEINNNGVESRWVEVRRTDEFVEIHDKKRAFTLFLYNDRATIQRGQAPLQPWQSGAWGKPPFRAIFVCSLETGQGQSFQGSGVLAFSPDGQSLVIGAGPNLRQVDIAKKKDLQVAKVTATIRQFAFSPNGKTLAVAAGEPKVHLLDATTLKPKKTWPLAGVGNVWRASWADDQTLVCHTGEALVVLNAGTGTVRHSYPLAQLRGRLPKNSAKISFVQLHAIPGTTQAFVGTKSQVPSGRMDNGNFLFNWATGKAGNLYIRDTQFGSAAAAVAPDLTVAALGDGGILNDIILFNPTSGQALKDGKDGKVIRLLRPAVRGANGNYWSIRWRPDGKGIFWIKLADGADRGVAEFDFEQLALRPLPEKDIKKYENELIALTLGETPGQVPEPEGVLPVGADGKPLNLDFETGTLKDWVAEGDAFAKQPIKGDPVGMGNGVVSRRQGQFWIRSNTKTQGTLTSVPFKITHAWGSFLIGGGPWPETCVELVLKDKNEVFYRASGLKEQTMLRVVVDLQPHKDKEMFIRIVDKHSQAWGFIEFDDFRFHALKPKYPPRSTLLGTLHSNRPNRGLLHQWGPLSLQKGVAPKIEVGGGPQPVQWPAGAAVYWDLTFAAGGRVVYEYWGSPVLQVWDSATGKRLHATHVVQSYIQSIAVSPRPACRYVLIGSADQTLTIYNPETGKVLLTVFPAGQDWIAWTPEGYYAATPGGERLMGWHVDNGPDQLASFYPAERFRKTLHRPDVIKLVLEKGSVAEALKAADKARKQVTRDVSVDQLLPPRVTVTILDKSTLPTVKVRVSATASAKGQPITGLRLLVDGRAVAGKKSSVEFAAGQQEFTDTWTIDLPGAKAEGNYKLVVLARGVDTSSISEPVEVRYIDKTKLPALHILTIGINKYKDPQLTLKAAREDAEALYLAFTRRVANSGMYRVVEGPKPLLDQQAGRQAVRDALAKLRKEVQPSDLVVVFFAGHGVRTQDGLYLLTADADAKNDATLAKTALSGAELRKTLGEFPCQVLLMLDACHAGAFGDATGKKGVLAAKGYKPATDDLTRELTADVDGVAVLCAAMANERAQEKDGHGLFTRAVLAALNQEPGVPFNPRNRLLYVHHLYSFIFDQVAYESVEEQHPFLHLPWTIQSFPISKIK